VFILSIIILKKIYFESVRLYKRKQTEQTISYLFIYLHFTALINIPTKRQLNGKKRKERKQENDKKRKVTQRT
jgi:hypothetical protein